MYSRVVPDEPSVLTYNEPLGSDALGAPEPAEILIPPSVRFSSDGFNPFAIGIVILLSFTGVIPSKCAGGNTLAQKPPNKGD